MVSTALPPGARTARCPVKSLRPGAKSPAPSSLRSAGRHRAAEGVRLGRAAGVTRQDHRGLRQLSDGQVQRPEIFPQTRGSQLSRDRDDFRKRSKPPSRFVQRSVGGCGKSTVGPSDETPDAVASIRAAHICAAAPGGPRYDETKTPEQRAGIENGIWTCANQLSR